jgi:hypothetical protein
MSWLGNALFGQSRLKGYDMTPQQLTQAYTPKTYSVDTSRYTALGEEFLDPYSSRNRGMYNDLKKVGVDAAAQQYLNSMRMQAAGQNPFATGQLQSSLASNLEGTRQAYNSYLNNAYQTGTGLLGYSLQGNLANAAAQNTAAMQGSQSALNYQLQKMQADAAMQMQRSQNQSGFFGGLFGNLVGAAPALLFGTQSSAGLLKLLGLG